MIDFKFAEKISGSIAERLAHERQDQIIKEYERQGIVLALLFLPPLLIALFLIDYIFPV